MEFFTPGSYRRQIATGIPFIEGSIIVPVLKPIDLLLGKDLDQVDYYQRRLLDPQMYLATLDPVQCSEKCTNLATYDWFDVGELTKNRTTSVRGMQKWIHRARKIIHDYWPSRLPRNGEVAGAVSAALATQERLGCEALIIPGPLTIDVNSDYTTELEWLDSGIELGRGEFDSPLLATVAISDHALRSIDPYDNRLVDTVLDHVSARDADGVYIALELGGEDGYYCTSQSTVGALLRFVDGFKRAGMSRVVVNYATVAGLIAFAVGADTWCTGWYQSERRLRRDDCEDKLDQIAAYPAYYSHPLASEIHLKQDVERLLDDEGMYDDLADVTDYSRPLLDSLRRGLGVAGVYEWEFAKNRTSSAKAHFSTVMARESNSVVSMTADGRLDYVDKWLERAVKLATKINALDGIHDRTELKHQRSWLKAFRKFVDSR